MTHHDVEVMQYDGSMESAAAIIAWGGGDTRLDPDSDDLILRTPEGEMRVRKNSWVVRQELGAYPARDKAFKRRFVPNTLNATLTAATVEDTGTDPAPFLVTPPPGNSVRPYKKAMPRSSMPPSLRLPGRPPEEGS